MVQTVPRYKSLIECLKREPTCDALAIFSMRSTGVVGVAKSTSSIPCLSQTSLTAYVSSRGISGTSRPETNKGGHQHGYKYGIDIWAFNVATQRGCCPGMTHDLPRHIEGHLPDAPAALI